MCYGKIMKKQTNPKTQKIKTKLSKIRYCLCLSHIIYWKGRDSVINQIITKINI
jgi:hypothetical protein